MLASIQALLTESSFAVFAGVALFGAAAAYAYVPLVGKQLAAVLLAVAAGLVAYDAGYITRGNLDQSGNLSADLAEQKREAEVAQQIAGEAAQRQRAADAKAQDLNQRIADYERDLAARDALAFSAPALSAPDAPKPPATCPTLDRRTCGCLLNSDDARRLRDLTAR